MEKEPNFLDIRFDSMDVDRYNNCLQLIHRHSPAQLIASCRRDYHDSKDFKIKTRIDHRVVQFHDHFYDEETSNSKRVCLPKIFDELLHDEMKSILNQNTSETV